MKKILRPFGINLSILITHIIKIKHKPNIVVITGSGETSLVRELLYNGIKDIEPTRRNLEKPEAEFSIPLTIFGEYKYPRNIISWIKLYIKTLLQLLYIKPYKHTLIIEINSFNEKILDKWLPILSPTTLFVVGKFDKNYKSEKVIINTNKDLINTVIDQIAHYISHKYNEPFKQIYDKLLENNLPQSRINFAKSPKGNIVVDATYFQFAPPIQTILEILSVFPSNKKIIGEIPSSWKQNKEISKIIKINNFNDANSGDVVILVGERSKVLNFRRNLFI